MAHVLIVGSHLSRLLGLLSLIPDDLNARTVAHPDDVFERAIWSASRDRGAIIVALEGTQPLRKERLAALHTLLDTASSTLFFVDDGATALKQQLHAAGANVLHDGDPPEVIAAGLILFFSRTVGTTP